MMCALVLVIREREESIEGHNDVAIKFIASYFFASSFCGGSYIHLYTIYERNCD